MRAEFVATVYTKSRKSPCFPVLSFALTAPQTYFAASASTERNTPNSADCGLISKRATAVRAFDWLVEKIMPKTWSGLIQAGW